MNVVILADQAPPLAIIIGIAIFIALAVFALFLFRGYEHLARRSLKRRYADLDVHTDPRAGMTGRGTGAGPYCNA